MRHGKKYDLLHVIRCNLRETGKKYDLLPVICWYRRETWQEVRFVAYDLLVSV